MYKYEIHSDINVILVKWMLKEGADFASNYQKIGEEIVNDPDFVNDMNMITDYRHAVLPESELYYNDMTKKIKFKSTVALSIRVLDDSCRIYKQYLDIFNIFYKGDRFIKKVKTVYSVSAAFKALGISEHEERLKGFFDSE